LTCTAIFVSLAVWHPAYRALTIKSTSLWIVSFIISMVCLYALGCYKQIARKVPLNYFLLAVFTIAFSYSVSCTTNLYTPETVAIAAILTASVTVALTAYAIKRGA
jgi:FtsH-binding integral membrane protein